MSVEPFGIALFLVGMICLALGRHAMATVFMLVNIFGSAAAGFFGENTIQPAHVFLAFMLIAIGLNRADFQAGARTLRPSEPGFWLACFVAFCVLTAQLLPRILPSTIEIFPVGVEFVGDSAPRTVPLQPTSSNFTQSIYLIADFVCFLLIVGVASNPKGYRAIVWGVIALGVANVLFAVIDLVTYATGTADTLEFMRNARYILRNDEEVAGMKRIVGSFVEASTFARFTLAMLAFGGTLWIFGRFRLWAMVITLGSLVLLIMSTSSTAIVGLPFVGLMLYLTTWQAAFKNSAIASWAPVLVIPTLLVLVVAVILLDPNTSRVVGDFLSTTIFNKLETQSGIERSAWNATAMQAFLDSWGLGVGMGTTRASNFFLAMIASVGVIGVGFYAAFLWSCFGRPRGEPRSLQADVQVAIRNAVLTMIIADLLIGTLIDQGLIFFALLALASASPLRAREPTGVRRHTPWKPA